MKFLSHWDNSPPKNLKLKTQGAKMKVKTN